MTKSKTTDTFLAYFVILSLYLALHTFGAFQRKVLGLNITTWDLLFPIFLLLIMPKLLWTRIRVDKTFKSCTFIFVPFLLWYAIEMVRNPHFKSITLLLLLTRAYFFLFIVYIYVRSLKRLEGLNNLIFLLGTSSSLLFTFIYIHVLNIGSPDRQGIIYEVGEFGIVRLEGFAGDPNFFGMLMLLPLACGFQWHVSRGKFVLKTIALFLIITNIALTVSRTILISSLLGLLIMCFLMVYRSLRYSKKLLGVMVKFSLVTACCLGAAFLFKGPFMEVKPFSYYSKRLFVPTPRFSYWTELLDMFVKKPLAGHGLRMVEQTLGGFGKYGHNTYLELLVETGLIGFIMFALFMLLVFLKGVKVMNSNSEIIPWLYVWIVIFVMFGGFTLLQYPYVWMVAGVILSRRLHKNQS